MTKSNDYKQILNDVWMLFLENLTWYEVKTYGQVPLERFSHASCVIGSQLVIFGGLNGKNFCTLFTIKIILIL